MAAAAAAPATSTAATHLTGHNLVIVATGSRECRDQTANIIARTRLASNGSADIPMGHKDIESAIAVFAAVFVERHL